MTEETNFDQEAAEEESPKEINMNKRFETLRGAALVGKDSFTDQIDYYDPEEDELV
jgi:hypothetical protein